MAESRSAWLCVLCLLLACEAPATSEGVDLAELPLLAVEEEARFGSVEDPDLGFTRIRDVDVDEEGRVYVLESGAQEIRVLAPDGSVERRIGREGDGPGEFRSAYAIGVFGDTIWALDGRPNRITLFDRDGEVRSTGRVEQARVALPTCAGLLRPIGMRSDGLFPSEMRSIFCTRDDPESDVEEGDSIPVPRVLFDAAGAVVDTVGWDPIPPPTMVTPPGAPERERRQVTVDDDRYTVPTPPRGLPAWAPLLDGRIILDAPVPEPDGRGSFAVTRRGLEGDTIYRRVFAYDAEPYTDSDLDTIADRAAGSGGRQFILVGDGTAVASAGEEMDDAERRRVASRLREEMDFPDYRRAVDEVWTARDGGVWIQYVRPEGDPEAPTRFLVLDPDGRPRGRVELPPDTEIEWSRDDTVWAVETDDFDVPWLVRYRIVG